MNSSQRPMHKNICQPNQPGGRNRVNSSTSYAAINFILRYGSHIRGLYCVDNRKMSLIIVKSETTIVTTTVRRTFASYKSLSLCISTYIGRRLIRSRPPINFTNV